MELKRACVFCGSRDGVRPAYASAATALAKVCAVFAVLLRRCHRRSRPLCSSNPPLCCSNPPLCSSNPPLCSSNPRAPILTPIAPPRAQEMVRRDIGLVYGGGTVGLMGVIARGVADGLGPQRVFGVIPSALTPREISNEMIGDTRVVNDMHERKVQWVGCPLQSAWWWWGGFAWRRGAPHAAVCALGGSSMRAHAVQGTAHCRTRV